MPRIAVLSEELINKIAAGEVVERPASVVKELCENSVDAGARSLKVTLAGGGLTRIVVADDGSGMSREDALLSLRRHATSKLKDLDGLFHILTKGFRGEAIPAIASVSRFCLLTSEKGAAVGTRLSVDGGGEPVVEDAAPVEGTVIEVGELFFNTPARRKFMKREQTELAHCEDALIRLALAHPELSVRLEHQGSVLFSSPATEDLRERIAAAIGAQVHPHLVEVEERRLGLTITGYIATPDFTLGNARGVYTFVNRRYVRDRGLNHALQRAFQDTLPGSRQPVAVLFIEMDPRAVDVNVHPQKLEVRFSDARGIHDAMVAGVGRALRGSGWFSAGEAPTGAPGEPVAGAHYAAAVDRFLTRAQEAAWGAPLPLPSAGESPPAPLTGGESPFARPAGEPVGFGQLRPSLNQAPPPGYFAALRPLGMLARRFLVCEGAGGSLVVVDPHAALERVRLHALRKLWKDGADPAQRALFSATVELGAAEAKALAAHGESLERLGIEAEPFGGSAFAVKSVPAVLAEVDGRELLAALAAQAPAEGGEWEGALQALACLAARTGSRELSPVETRALFQGLEDADFRAPARHDRVVLRELPLLELEPKN